MALHPYVRRNGPEGDYHLLTPLEFHSDTSELIQRLSKGHKNVEVSAEEWDRLVTWIDLNVPYFGTWSERGARQDWIQRRRALERDYSNRTFNPEAIVNPYQPVAFVPPKPVEMKQEPVTAPVRMDPLSGEKTLTLDLGNGQTLNVLCIPSGEFAMGSTRETAMEQPVAVVKIKTPFWIGETEVSVAQFKAFDPAHDNGVYDMHYKDQCNRGYFMNRDDQLPAIRISWEKADAFCKWLSKKSGKKVRLPTEARWEWACRAGTQTPLWFGDFNADFSACANLADAIRIEMAVVGVDPKPWKNPPKDVDFELRDLRFNDGVLHLAKVGSFKANAWGLKDMCGNVSEWTRSAFRPYPYKDSDGRNNSVVDEKKVVRGGSWNDRQIKATSSWRWGYPGWMRPFDVGFRVVVEE